MMIYYTKCYAFCQKLRIYKKCVTVASMVETFKATHYTLIELLYIRLKENKKKNVYKKFVPKIYKYIRKMRNA